MALVWLAIVRNWKAGLAVLLVAVVLGYVWTLQRQISSLTALLENQKLENAQMRGTLAQLNETMKTLKPGETKVITVDRPQFIQLPGQTITKEIPVIVTRTEKTVETKVETVTLPPKEIERILTQAPQSLVFDLTATRDIKAGEKFRVIASMIQPGVYQPILDLGAPIAAEVRTVTPIERIPQVRAPSRLTYSLLVGPDVFHPRGATLLTRAEIEYQLTPATSRFRSYVRGEVGWVWNGAGAEGRLLYGIRF